MLHRIAPITLILLAFALFFAPSDQASLWSAPGAPSQSHSTLSAPPSSLFRTLRDRLIEVIWPRPEREASKKQAQDAIAPSTTPDQLLKIYGSDVVLRFELRNQKERKALSEAADTLFLDIWQFTADVADIRLSKEIIDPLFGLLPPSIKYKPLIHNLAQAVYESQSTASESPSCPSAAAKVLANDPAVSPAPRSNPVFERYQPLSVIVPWMRLLQSMFSTHVKVFQIGTSFEGRGIPAIRVGSHPHNAERYESPRKTIIAIGGQHAREWISTAAINYAAYELITAYGKNRRTTKFIEEFDFVFIPTLNPDGYVYTWETDRLWRKTRQETHLSFCPGMDLDRSFGFEWDGQSTKGNPCSESYAGESAFAATESTAFAHWLRNETENNNVEVVGFLDFHSYSQQILYPFAYSCEKAPPAYEDLQELAIGLQKAMHLTNKKLYTVASACESSTYAQGPSGGGSALDWVFSQSIKYSYQVKLPDTGSYGFLLPARHIVPTGKEVYNAVTYFAEFLLSSVKMDTHDESPSAKEPVFFHSPNSAEEAPEGSEIDIFISDELDEPEDAFELRKRR